MEPDALGEIRDSLDKVDRRIVEMLGARQEIIDRVAALKAGGTELPRDPLREEEILARLGRDAEAAGLDPELVTTLFRQILDHSVRHQNDHLVTQQNPDLERERIHVSYQGSEGAYSHVVARRHFAPRQAELVCKGYDTFREILEAVDRGEADYAVLPVENTTAGSINEAYDLLGRMNLAAVGEEILRIDHCLMALESIPLSSVRRIASHPQALAQCSEFLASLSDCQAESYVDTAMAAARIRDDNDLSQAAIASEEAARLHGLHIIQRNVANQKENYTRFLIIARELIRYDMRIPCKTSVILATHHEQGALVRCLNILDARGLNLTKLESRPRQNNPWEYLFYVDFEGNLGDPVVEEVLGELAPRTSYLKVLGSYPARTEGRREPSK
jgi:chorismate mutase/prephenate dehydratase